MQMFWHTDSPLPTIAESSAGFGDGIPKFFCCFNPRFNPLGEDVATGVAAMSLASVYAKKDEQIIIEQGYILNSPSNIFVTKSLADLIYMGGRVSLSSEKIDLNKLLAEVNNDPNSSPQRLLQS